MATNVTLEYIKAMIAARQEFKALVKNKVNPHFKSKYADLEALHEAVDDALAKHGFAVSHILGFDEKDRYGVTTRLLHTSGGEDRSFFVLPTGVDPQKLSAAVTYGRRIGLSSLLAIPSEDDDDGNAAAAPSQKKTYVVKKPDAPPPKPQEPLVVPDKDDPADTRNWETVTVLKVSKKDGNTNGKPWTLYGVLMADGQGDEFWGNTFDHDYGAVASSLQGGKLARVALEEGKEYKGKKTVNIVGIEPMPDEDGGGNVPF